jgi:hypothetical protein
LFAEVDKVLAATSADGSMGAIDEKEFKLAYTDKYEAFIASFEAKLEEYIKSKKCTVEEFYELCKKVGHPHDSSALAWSAAAVLSPVLLSFAHGSCVFLAMRVSDPRQ